MPFGSASTRTHPKFRNLERIWQGGSPVSLSLSSEACVGQHYNSCKLEISEEDAAEFRSLIYNQKALAVFMYVTIGNSSEVVDNTEERLDEGGKTIPSELQKKEKWAWIRDQRGKFLATLPYDFDILSLTTLTRDVFDLTVHVNSTPPDCFLNMTDQCIGNKVAGLLTNLVEFKLGNLCIKANDNSDVHNTVSYLCCARDKDENVKCNIPIKSNKWIAFAIYLLWVLALIFGLFSPLLFRYFPKEFRKGSRSKSRQRSMRQSGSSHTLDSLTIVPTQRLLFEKDDTILDVMRTSTKSVMCARISRCLFIILVAFFPVLQALLYLYLKKEEVGIDQKNVGVGDAYLTLIAPTEQVTVTTLYCFCILLICIAVAIPHSLSDLARRLAGRRDERSFLGFEKPDKLICSLTDRRGFQLLYENMVFHLNAALTLEFWKFVFQVTVYPLKKLCSSSSEFDDSAQEEQAGPPGETQPLIRVAKPPETETETGICTHIINTCFIIIFYPIWVILIQTAFIAYLIPITYVAFRIWRMLFRLEVKCGCCDVVPVIVKLIAFPLLYLLFVIFCCCVEVAYFLLIAILSVNVMFFGSVIGFTVTGLIFYIDFFLPYIVLAVLGLVYIIQGINNYHTQYVSLKNAIFEACEKQDAEVSAEAIRGSFSGQVSPPSPANKDRKVSSSSQMQRSIRTYGLVYVDDDDVLSIPFDLFLVACSKFLPFKRIILAKLLKLVAIAGYLMAIFSFVMSLDEFAAATPLVQSIAILLLGALPLVYSRKFSVSETEQKRMTSHLQDLVKKYQRNSSS